MTLWMADALTSLIVSLAMLAILALMAKSRGRQIHVTFAVAFVAVTVLSWTSGVWLGPFGPRVFGIYFANHFVGAAGAAIFIAGLGAPLDDVQPTSRLFAVPARLGPASARFAADRWILNEWAGNGALLLLTAAATLALVTFYGYAPDSVF